MQRVVALGAWLSLLSLLPAPARSQPRAAPSEGYHEWPVAGGPNNIRYSRLTQINRSNVARLKVAWTYDTGDMFPGSQIQCNPLVVDGVLYATSPKLRVFALDAASGKPLWSFIPEDKALANVRSPNRGVTFWRDGEERRIFVVIKSYLYALDARTGKVIDTFGRAGRVDLREGLGRDPANLSVGSHSPGVVHGDLYIVGSIVSEVLPAAPGDVRAYDVRTGKLRWSFHTIPHPGEPGYETWPKDAWSYAGGANAWSGLSLDREHGIVFAPTGSASFDFYGANRIGDNLYANSVIALDAQTGKRLWHYQTVHHDVWDRDLPTPPSLVTVRRGGRLIDAVAQPTKSGYVFVLDRLTGKPLFPVVERPVPASDVDGERLAKTQPIPTLPPPFARQRLSKDLITKRTPEVRKATLQRWDTLRTNGGFDPPSPQGTLVFPGLDGGAEWGGSAFDPETGLFYVNANETPFVIRLVERTAKPDEGPAGGRTLYMQLCANCHRDDMKGTPPEFPSLVGITARRTREQILDITRKGNGRMPGLGFMPEEALRAVIEYVTAGTDQAVSSAVAASNPMQLKYGFDGYTRFLDADGYPAVEPPWGTLNAIDLDRGKIVWKVPLGEIPDLVARGLRNTGSENYGGPVVTAGGLVFIGATGFDRKFRAFDKRTGKVLWEAELPAGGNATPAVYEVGGRQFVVIAAGGGKSKQRSGGSYVAFALPEASAPTDGTLRLDRK